MGIFDLISLILDNLGRRKARVSLTAVGVVIGTAAIIVLVSLGIGLQRNATQQLFGIGDLTQIQVSPSYGDYGPGPVMVESVGGGGKPGVPSNQKLLTEDALQELAAIPGVVAVVPRDYLQFGETLTYGKLLSYPSIMGIGLSDLSQLGWKAQSGTLVLEKGKAVVGYAFARNFYDPKQRPGDPPPTPPDLQDASLRLTLVKYTPDGQQPVRRSFQLEVIGVIAQSGGDADYNIFMPMEDVKAFNEWGSGRRINRNRDGYSQVVVKVDEVNNVMNVSDAITAMGFQAFSPQPYVQGINSFYVILQVVFGGVGAMALVVAAIGIANTMAMAILERTREIGLMKAIGATNRDVLSVFLGESAGIGLLGGLGGVLLGWSAGQIMNVLVQAYFAGQAARSGGMPPPSVAVYTPLWLPLFALVFSIVIGLLSGLYPALRAATMIPVDALKYE